MPLGFGLLFGIRGGIILGFGFFLMFIGHFVDNINLRNIGIWILLVGGFLFVIFSFLLGIKRGKWKRH